LDAATSGLVTRAEQTNTLLLHADTDPLPLSVLIERRSASEHGVLGAIHRPTISEGEGTPAGNKASDDTAADAGARLVTDRRRKAAFAGAAVVLVGLTVELTLGDLGPGPRHDAGRCGPPGAIPLASDRPRDYCLRLVAGVRQFDGQTTGMDARPYQSPHAGLARRSQPGETSSAADDGPAPR
jgi:hypothetical protein